MKGKKIVRPGYPQTAQQTKLCHEYIKDYNIIQSALRAGFSQGYAKREAHAMIKRFMPYIQTLQDKKTTQVVAKVVYDQDTILQSMARAAFADPADFVERVKVKYSGKVRTMERVKSIFDLTPEQRSCIRNVQEMSNGRIKYELMDPQENRKLLGMHQGLFHQKLIAEHRHAHLHATLDLSKLDDRKLAKLEEDLLQLLGPQAARILGHIPPPEESDG